MSGILQYRVNRGWDSTIQTNVTPARFFWDWLHFINDHSGYQIVEVGTGTTSHGVVAPAQWLAWDGTTDPTTLTPPMTNNSWFVFRALYADALLNGGGTMQWEAKIQMTLGSAYADPSGTDYGFNGVTYHVILRTCPAAGWTGTPTWDFAPGGGQEASRDLRLMGYTISQANTDYNLDIVGDDDTIWWRGVSGNYPVSNKSHAARGGYLGMISRRNSDITWPFIALIGPVHSGTNGSSGGDMLLSRHSAFTDYGVFNYKREDLQWPSYSMGHDDTRVETHRADVWSLNAISYMNPFHYTGEGVYPRMTLMQFEQPDQYAIIGEFRGYVTTPTSIGFGVVFGANSDLIQTGAYGDTYGGIAMPWPSGVAPIW